jgi:hypothetical protein
MITKVWENETVTNTTYILNRVRMFSFWCVFRNLYLIRDRPYMGCGFAFQPDLIFSRTKQKSDVFFLPKNQKNQYFFLQYAKNCRVRFFVFIFQMNNVVSIKKNV